MIYKKKKYKFNTIRKLIQIRHERSINLEKEKVRKKEKERRLGWRREDKRRKEGRKSKKEGTLKKQREVGWAAEAEGDEVWCYEIQEEEDWRWRWTSELQQKEDKDSIFGTTTTRE